MSERINLIGLRNHMQKKQISLPQVSLILKAAFIWKAEQEARGMLDVNRTPAERELYALLHAVDNA